jgi:F-box domain
MELILSHHHPIYIFAVKSTTKNSVPKRYSVLAVSPTCSRYGLRIHQAFVPAVSNNHPAGEPIRTSTRLARARGMASNGNTSALHRLPAELLLHIAEASLPVSSILALRQTCSRFRNFFPLPQHDLAAINLSRKSRKAKFAFLEMLQRDSHLHDIQACKECFHLHSSAEYSPFELCNAPSERQCLYTSILWACPHRYMTFSKCRELLDRADALQAKGRYVNRDLEGCAYCHARCSSVLQVRTVKPLSHLFRLNLLSSIEPMQYVTISAAKQ